MAVVNGLLGGDHHDLAQWVKVLEKYLLVYESNKKPHCLVEYMFPICCFNNFLIFNIVNNKSIHVGLSMLQ